MGIRMLLAATFLVVLSQSSAWSGRAVTDEEERMKLAAALTAEGCSGGEVEFDKGKYEVEAAMCRDGKEYDLVFDANFKLLGRELDDQEFFCGASGELNASSIRHACMLHVEGIVSKRKGSPYRSGRTPDWVKCKNPASPAVKREAEEDWGRQGTPDHFCGGVRGCSRMTCVPHRTVYQPRGPMPHEAVEFGMRLWESRFPESVL